MEPYFLERVKKELSSQFMKYITSDTPVTPDTLLQAWERAIFRMRFTQNHTKSAAEKTGSGQTRIGPADQKPVSESPMPQHRYSGFAEVAWGGSPAPRDRHASRRHGAAICARGGQAIESTRDHPR
jgi:hypothetical protein